METIIMGSSPQLLLHYTQNHFFRHGHSRLVLSRGPRWEHKWSYPCEAGGSY